MEKSERIDKAANRFKKVARAESYHYDQKFRFLPGWLDNTSYYFEKEANRKLPKGYYHFKRGAIIRVNFGTNLGSEFSNIHFAIVLDKKDSPKKKTLTVLPLTSKQKSNRFPLGKEVFSQTVTLLIIQLQQIKLKLDKLRSTGDTRSIDFTEVDRDIKDLQEVINLYMRYNKNSFVRLTDITTISKLRIQRLNRFDPSGKIRLSSQQMAAISHGLLKLYLNK